MALRISGGPNPFLPGPIASADGDVNVPAAPIPTDAAPPPMTGADLRAQVTGGGPIPVDYSLPDRSAEILAAEEGRAPASNVNDQATRFMTSPGDAIAHHFGERPKPNFFELPPEDRTSWVFPESERATRARAAAAVAADHATEKSPVTTYPGAPGGPAAPASPAEPQSGSELRAMLASLGGGGSGGGASGSFDAFKQRQAALDKAQTREDELLAMRQDAGRFNASEISKEANAMQRYAEDAQKRGESQGKEAKGREAAFARAAEEAAGDRINPDHYKETRTGFQAGMDILGAIFGGLGAAKGGPNVYAEHLNAKIARDIEAQRSNHAIKVEGVDAKKTAYGMMLDRFHNDGVAAAAAHAAEIDKWKAMGDARAALDDNVKAQADWAKTSEHFDAKRAEYADAARIAAHKAAMGPDKLAELERLLKLKKGMADIEHTRAETGKLNVEAQNPGGKAAVVNLPNGQQAAALSTEHGADFTQRMLGADKFQRAVSEMQEIQKKATLGTVLSPTDRERYKGLAAEAKTAYVQMNGFKRTPNETEFHALDRIVPPDAGVLSVSRGDVLAQASRLAEDARRDAAQANLKDPSAVGGAPAATGARTGAELRAQVTGRPKSFEGVGP